MGGSVTKLPKPGDSESKVVPNKGHPEIGKTHDDTIHKKCEQGGDTIHEKSEHRVGKSKNEEEVKCNDDIQNKVCTKTRDACGTGQTTQEANKQEDDQKQSSESEELLDLRRFSQPYHSLTLQDDDPTNFVPNRVRRMSYNRTLSTHTSSHLIPLPAGGFWMQLGDITMQIGCPPETIKDSMRMGLEVPRYFIVHGELFDRVLGINTAELEFPAYFNFFIRKQKTIIITTKEIEERIRRVFQETLLGPKPEDFDISQDFDPSLDSKHYPDFSGEGLWLDPGRQTLTVDTLLEFKEFQSIEDDSAVLECQVSDDVRVSYETDNHRFVIESVSNLDQPLIIPQETIRVDHNQMEALSMFRKEVTDEDLALELPLFGITMLGTSHGFDQNGTTTGFVLWANRRGTMVDPPPNAMQCLAALGISSRVIDSIVLTHCHSDHDAGTFRKLLFDQHIHVVTTKTIIDSFIRKYSAITGFAGDFLHGLFSCKTVKVGEPTILHGAKWEFFYSLHTIPCMGFKVTLGDKTLVYSADTHTDPDLAMQMYQEGVIGEGRRDLLMNFPWDSDLILHEAGVPPIHTPMSVLQNLSDDIKSRMYIVHVTAKDVPKESGLRMLHRGKTVSLPIQPNPTQRAIEILDLFSTIDIFREAMTTFQDALDVMYMVEYVSFKSGELIVREGDPGDKCFIILKGKAVVSWMVAEQQFTKSYHVGDYFGETSLVTGAPRNANVVAEGGVEAVAITRDTFLTLIKGTNIKNYLVSLAETRNKQSWQLMQKNSVVSNLTSSCKTTLETLMTERSFSKGEVVWRCGDMPEFVILVRTGTFNLDYYPGVAKARTVDVTVSLSRVLNQYKSKGTPSLGWKSKPAPEFQTMDEAASRDRIASEIIVQEARGNPSAKCNSSQHVALSKGKVTREGYFKLGTFIGDFDAMLGGDPLSSEVTSVEDSSAMVIRKDRWVQFCSNYPGALLFFLNKQFVT